MAALFSSSIKSGWVVHNPVNRGSVIAGWNTYRVAFLVGKSDERVITIPFIKLIATVKAQTSSSIELTLQLHLMALADSNPLIASNIYVGHAIAVIFKDI